MNIESIPVRQIKTLKSVQPRFETDQERVGDFAELLMENEDFEFPPLTIFRDAYGANILADGFTRIGAYLIAERKLVACEVKDGDEAAASWYALGANMRHGTPLSRDEKRVVLYKALDHPNRGALTQDEIADMIGVSRSTVTRAIADRKVEARKEKAPKKEKAPYSAEAMAAIVKIGECNEAAKVGLLDGSIKKPEDELIAFAEYNCEQQLRLAPLFFLRDLTLKQAINLLAQRPTDPDVKMRDYLHYAMMRGTHQSWQFYDDSIEVTVNLLRETAPAEIVRPSKSKAPEAVSPVEEELI